jgi:hypothetical protein
MNIFSLFPEWSVGMDIDYSFTTVIHSSTNKKEQRVSLRDLPAREVSFKLLENAPQLTKEINKLLYTLRSEIAVPIFTEAFWVSNTGSLLGVTTLLSSGLTYLFNLQKYAGGLIIVDKTKTLPHEFRTISFVDNTQVVIDPIEGNILAANAIFYPAIVGTVQDIANITDINDNLSDLSLSFKERYTLSNDISYEEWQDSDSGAEYEDSASGSEYQNI